MNNRTRYANVTGVKGLAVIPTSYTDDDIDAVLSGTIRPFTIQPKFLGKVTYRARFTVRGDDSIKRSIIIGQE